MHRIGRHPMVLDDSPAKCTPKLPGTARSGGTQEEWDNSPANSHAIVSGDPPQNALRKGGTSPSDTGNKN